MAPQPRSVLHLRPQARLPSPAPYCVQRQGVTAVDCPQESPFRLPGATARLRRCQTLGSRPGRQEQWRTHRPATSQSLSPSKPSRASRLSTHAIAHPNHVRPLGDETARKPLGNTCTNPMTPERHGAERCAPELCNQSGETAKRACLRAQSTLSVQSRAATTCVVASSGASTTWAPSCARRALHACSGRNVAPTGRKLVRCRRHQGVELLQTRSQRPARWASDTAGYKICGSSATWVPGVRR